MLALACLTVTHICLAYLVTTTLLLLCSDCCSLSPRRRRVIVYPAGLPTGTMDRLNTTTSITWGHAYWRDCVTAPTYSGKHHKRPGNHCHCMTWKPIVKSLLTCSVTKAASTESLPVETPSKPAADGQTMKERCHYSSRCSFLFQTNERTLKETDPKFTKSTEEYRKWNRGHSSCLPALLPVLFALPVCQRFSPSVVLPADVPANASVFVCGARGPPPHTHTPPTR